jgi:hypothetical protein
MLEIVDLPSKIYSKSQFFFFFIETIQDSLLYSLRMELKFPAHGYFKYNVLNSTCSAKKPKKLN